MSLESGRVSRPVEPVRDVEAVVLVALIEAPPEGLTESAVQRELTSVESGPVRLAAISAAIEGLLEAGLVVREADLLRSTRSALRAGELELGF